MLRATLNEQIVLSLQLSEGDAGFFPRAKIFNSSSNLIDTVNLSHVSGGLYMMGYTFTDAGYYVVSYYVFEDLDGTTLSTAHDVVSETVEVNSDKLNLIRILGLLHENAIIDSQVFDSDNNLTSARIRSYDSASNAQLSGSTGLQNQWAISAEYTSGKLSKYTITRVL